LAISALDTISLAIQHTKQQLAQPFRVGQWTRLAFVGLLAGELGSGGGCNSMRNFKIPQHPGISRHFIDAGLPNLGIDPAALAAFAGLIAVLIVVAIVFGIVMMYVSSVMRFILFDSIVSRDCHIRAGWSRRQGPGWRYFLWQLGFGFSVFAGLVVIIGIPAAIGFAMGWLEHPREHVLPLVLLGIVVFFLVVLFLIVAAVVRVLTKDFVVPQMALEGIGPIEAWRRLWPMMQTEQGGYAAYVGMKIVLAIMAAIIIGIASLVVGLLLAIPAAVLAVIAVITGKEAGLTWNVETITIAVVVGCILLAIFLYVMSLIAVPAIVFFPAYSMYFFAGRYRPLSAVLYPASQSLAANPGAAASGPPFSPAPAG
jgi:hypothetical protein